MDRMPGEVEAKEVVGRWWGSRDRLEWKMEQEKEKQEDDEEVAEEEALGEEVEHRLQNADAIVWKKRRQKLLVVGMK